MSHLKYWLTAIKQVYSVALKYIWSFLSLVGLQCISMRAGKSKCVLYIAHLIHRPIEIMVLETYMLCKGATGFPQCDLKNCSNVKLRGKWGITCSLVNKSLVWFDGRVVYALHSIDFVYCSPFPGAGGFTYFKNCLRGETDCLARLRSPLIGSAAEWKCMQFWYYISYSQLKVLLVPKETSSNTSKTYNYRNSYGWILARVPLSANFTYRVSIIKNSLSFLQL